VEKLDNALLPINVNVQLDIMVILEIVHQFVLESMQEMQLFVAVLELVLALISAIAQAMFMVYVVKSKHATAKHLYKPPFVEEKELATKQTVALVNMVI
jgi:hypothetical protein